MSNSRPVPDDFATQDDYLRSNNTLKVLEKFKSHRSLLVESY